MSRIGHAHINIPAAATVEFKDNVVTVKGSNITMTRELKEGFEDNKALHGLYRSLINNMVTGVTEGFKKQLELVGVGYRASNNGQKLDLSLGFSHNIVIELPTEIKVETLTEKGKNPIITLSSHDNQLLGMIVAKIRSYRKPEPYKGKGIKYVGEIIRRKAGKSA